MIFWLPLITEMDDRHRRSVWVCLDGCIFACLTCVINAQIRGLQQMYEWREVKVQGKCFDGRPPNTLWFARNGLYSVVTVCDVATIHHYVLTCFARDLYFATFQKPEKGLILCINQILDEPTDCWLHLKMTVIYFAVFFPHYYDIFANQPNVAPGRLRLLGLMKTDFLSQINAFILQYPCLLHFPPTVRLQSWWWLWFCGPELRQVMVSWAKQQSRDCVEMASQESLCLWEK